MSLVASSNLYFPHLILFHLIHFYENVLKASWSRELVLAHNFKMILQLSEWYHYDYGWITMQLFYLLTGSDCHYQVHWTLICNWINCLFFSWWAESLTLRLTSSSRSHRTSSICWGSSPAVPPHYRYQQVSRTHGMSHLPMQYWIDLNCCVPCPCDV